MKDRAGAAAAKHGVAVVTELPGLMRTGSFGHALVKGERHAETSLLSLLSSLPLLTRLADRAAHLYDEEPPQAPP